MEIDVRRFDGDPHAYLEAGELAFSERPHDADRASWDAIFEPDRAIAAYDGDRIVGTAASFGFELTVPGGTLPAAAITIVGVHPTHRRRGILRRMMRAQLDDIHARGEPLAILWASEGGIYQRFGYGLATVRTRLNAERDRAAFRRPHVPAGVVRMVDVGEATRLFPPVHDAVLPTRSGMFARSTTYWEHEFFHDPEHWRRGASAAWHVVHEVAGEADGYARYRIREAWDDTGSKSTVVLQELMATNPAAHADLWRFLLDIDLMARLEAWNIAPDDPIVLLVEEPRRLGLAMADGIWLRVMDVAAAFAGRRYAADGRLVLEVDDEFCAWNDGIWEITVLDGVPSVRATSEPAELFCDVTDLGAAYLGAFSIRRLADAGRVRELQPGAVERADALLRPERAPWCPRVF